MTIKLKKLTILVFMLFFGISKLQAQRIDSLYNVYTKSSNQIQKDKFAKTILHNVTSNRNIYDSIKIENVIELAQAYKNDTILANATFFSALNACLVGDFPKAIALMYKSSKYFENIKDTFNQSFCIKEIGVYYRNLKNYKEAINNYNRAIALLKLYKDEDNWYMKIIYYQGLSRIYLEMQQPDSAYPILQDANLLAKKYNDTIIKYIGLDDLELRFNNLYSNYYAQKKDTTLAEVYYKKCFAANIDSVDEFTDSHFDACLRYSQMKVATKEYTTAIKYGTAAYDEARKKNNKLFIANSSEQLYKIFMATQQKDSSLKYLQIYYTYTDSIKRASAENDVISSSILLHIDQLEQIARDQEVKLKHQHNIQYSAIAVGILTLLLLFFIFSNSIIVNARTIELIGTIALLLVFEFINLFIHPYLGHWLHESPILMLLALVCIAVIIVPLHHKLEHYIKEKLIAKNNKIRLANAKKTIKELEHQ